MYLLGFCVYTGKTKSGITRPLSEIVDEIIQWPDLHTKRGHVLYVDNYYTSIKLARHLYEEYNWFLTGTLTLTE